MLLLAVLLEAVPTGFAASCGGSGIPFRFEVGRGKKGYCRCTLSLLLYVIYRCSQMVAQCLAAHLLPVLEVVKEEMDRYTTPDFRYNQEPLTERT